MTRLLQLAAAVDERLRQFDGERDRDPEGRFATGQVAKPDDYAIAMAPRRKSSLVKDSALVGGGALLTKEGRRTLKTAASAGLAKVGGFLARTTRGWWSELARTIHTTPDPSARIRLFCVCGPEGCWTALWWNPLGNLKEWRLRARSEYDLPAPMTTSKTNTQSAPKQRDTRHNRVKIDRIGTAPHGHPDLESRAALAA